MDKGREIDRRMISCTQEAIRLRMIKEGRSDAEIAIICGVTADAIRVWRQSKGIFREKEKDGGRPRGVPMEKALTPDECKRMRFFLSSICWAKKNWPDLTVGQLIKGFRGGDMIVEQSSDYRQAGA